LLAAAGRNEGSRVPFFIAFVFSALRCACAGFTLFSLGMVELVKEEEVTCNGGQEEIEVDAVQKFCRFFARV
jgi:hypothetical protein